MGDTIEYVKLQKCRKCGCVTTPLPAPSHSGHPVTMYFCGTCNHWFQVDKVDWVLVECKDLHTGERE